MRPRNPDQLDLPLLAGRGEIYDGRHRDEAAWDELLATSPAAAREAAGRAWLAGCDPAHRGARSYLRRSAASERVDDFRFGLAAGVGRLPEDEEETE